MKNSVKRHASALTAVLACLALALVLYHSLAGGTLLQSSPYNSYALQAENWLAGRNNIENGENYTWLELAIYQGRYYQSFPPVPAVLMLPFVAAAGEWSAIPGNLIAMGLALLCAGGQEYPILKVDDHDAGWLMVTLDIEDATVLWNQELTTK